MRSGGGGGGGGGVDGGAGGGERSHRAGRQAQYARFRQQNQPAFDYLEELAVNLGNPKFTDQLVRLTNEFCEWRKR
jgi:hypothetical protein